jgi:putative ABC transport system permease protein
MLRNYIKIAFRNLIKQRIYTAINVVGLAVSIASCLLIVLYVKHEVSYDTFFPEGDRVYKVTLERKYPNHATYFAAIPHSYATVMQKDFPEVEKTLQLQGPVRDIIITYKVKEGDVKSFEEDDLIFSDSSFFSFFDLDLTKGEKLSALAASNQVVVSSSTAKRYFDDEDPLGKVIRIFNEDYKVTAVFKDLPDNSHLKFDFIAAFNGTRFRQAENFISFDSQTYIKLKPGSDYKALEAKFPAMVDRYASGQIERELGQSWEDYQKAGNGYRYFLQPLTSIHLDPTNIEFTMTPSGNLKYIYSLAFIAALILVIACINFMNLATARSAERAREVGVRKVMGSLKNQLIIQFLVEAILLTIIGTVIAVAAAYVLLPSFNNLVEKNLHLIFAPDVIAGLVGFALLVGVLAGVYPAFVLSSYNPVVVMKGNFTASGKGTWLRNGLVIFQFMISIVLIVGTLVVGSQMKFMQSKDLGFDKGAMMMVGRAFDLDKKMQTFIDEVKKFPEVRSAAGTSSRVGNRDDVFGQMFQPEGTNEVLTVKSMVLDDDFAQNIGFELREGRFFSKETNDSLHVLLNETAVKTIGLKDPVGQKLSNTDLFRGDPVNEKQRHFTIIGVIKNFHFQSLRDEITPLVAFSKEIFGKQANSQYVAIRIDPAKLQDAIPKIETKWREFVPDKPFRYEFLEDNLNKGYAEEARSGKLFRVFSGLAIIIACVGLFGLSAYTASLRTKEIGIRKVMGASVGSVVFLLSKDFTRLVVISFVLAAPLAWWMMDTWLGGFAYRIPLGVDSFLVAGVLAFAIAGLTVSYQSIKAAVVNPVKSLKSE